MSQSRPRLSSRRSAAPPGAPRDPAPSARPDLPSRVMLRILEKKTNGGQMPTDLAPLRAMTNMPMSPIWLSRLPLASVRETTIPGPAGPLAARVYTPRGVVRGTLLYLHGGGFVHCGLDSHDGVCCRLARAAGCVVVAPSYRLAPENPFPAAPNDCLAALRWVIEHADTLGGRDAAGQPLVAVGGDSAGGNLAAVTCQSAHALGLAPLRFQLLFYPATHGIEDVPSRTTYARGYFLTAKLMEWYRDQYLDDERHHDDPAFAPALGDLRGLAPALVVTAEFDPLHDEGLQYAALLNDVGVPARHHCYPGTIHGFVSFYPMMPKGRQALAEAGRALRQAFA